MTAPPAPFAFVFTSQLTASADIVWTHATTMAGVNRELAPLVRMTHPTDRAALDVERIVLGERVFRSWILLFGVVPVDYDDLTFVEFDPGRRFLERSPMLTQREWIHERSVRKAAGGCIVEDRVQFTPRVAALGRLQLPIFRLAFRLRHRNLRRLFSRS